MAFTRSCAIFPIAGETGKAKLKRGHRPPWSTEGSGEIGKQEGSQGKAIQCEDDAGRGPRAQKLPEQGG